MAWILFSLIVSFAAGWLAVSLLWPSTRGTSLARIVFRMALGFGLGQGITSCGAFLYLLVHGRIDQGYCAFEVGVLAALAILFGLKRRQRNALPGVAGSDEPQTRGRVSLILAVGFYATAATALATVALRLWRSPDGAWDAWMTWNLRARALFRGGDAWRDAFSSLVTNPDYPLMLPMSVLRGWTYAGGETRLMPAALAWLFTAAVAGLVTSGVAALCGRAQGYVAGVVLLGYGFFVTHAGSEMAELPLMFFYASAVALLAFYNEQPVSRGRGVLVLAGAAAGLAAWTKNEGLLFILAFAIAHFAVVARSKGLKGYFEQALPLGAGLLPALALVIYFKTQIAGPSQLYKAGLALPQLPANLMDADRYRVIAREFARRFFVYEGLGINLMYMLLMLLVCCGVTLRHIVSVAQGALLLGLMLAGFFSIYLTLHANPVHVMRDSLDRVLLQLWPTFVFAFFLLAGPFRLAQYEQPRTGHGAGAEA